jgi:hypothetical protein
MERKYNLTGLQFEWSSETHTQQFANLQTLPLLGVGSKRNLLFLRASEWIRG